MERLGQSRFDFIWPVICQGALGVIILVDHNGKVPLEELEGYLDTFKDYTRIFQLVLHMLMKTRNILLPFIGSGSFRMSINIPVFIDARKQEHVLLMIESLHCSIRSQFKSNKLITL